MEPKLIALKLFLAELNIDPKIDEVESRKLIQKAVYIGQLSEVDLGYRYGWYKMGPYCPALTQNYYALDTALQMGDRSYEDKTLRQTVKEKLEKVKPLFELPIEFDGTIADWLELLASYHFLCKVRQLSHESAVRVLADEKEHIVAYVDQAKSKLNCSGLL